MITDNKYIDIAHTISLDCVYSDGSKNYIKAMLEFAEIYHEMESTDLVEACRENKELTEQRDKCLEFIEEIKKVDSVNFKKWYLFDKIKEKATEIINSISITSQKSK